MTYYHLLGVAADATPEQVRRAYRQQSKIYHPDTTTLAPKDAAEKFQQVNQAYLVLINPDQRRRYDLQLLKSPAGVTPPPQRRTPSPPPSSAFLDARDRTLSPGELFALFILGLTFVGCLLLAMVVGVTRGDLWFRSATASHPPPPMHATAPAAGSKFLPPRERSPSKQLLGQKSTEKSFPVIQSPKVLKTKFVGK
jgi:curved DNA-binding protein CbpA